MKGVLAIAVAFLWLSGSGCKELNPGRCNSTNDCPSGQSCDLSPAANGTCVCESPSCMDGGMGGSGGAGSGGGGSSGTGGGPGDGGQDIAPTCQPSCTSPRSICTPDLTCVECLTSDNCTTAAKPICDSTGGCVACTSDEQCVSKLGANPGVCMAHLDGHCATDPETIYVQNTAGCSDSVPAGQQGATVGTPFCSMDPVDVRVTSNRALVVVKGSVSGANWTFTGQNSPQISIVGHDGAFIAALGLVPGFAMTGGSAYVRGVKLTSALTGISAKGGTLRLDRVMVDGCMGGGILLDGAAFDIRNTTVTRNGPATDGTTSWGGILVKALPSSGPSRLDLVTLQNNNNAGLVCSAQIEAMGVFASGNMGGIDVNPTCAVITCSPMSSTCGSQ